MDELVAKQESMRLESTESTESTEAIIARMAAITARIASNEEARGAKASDGITRYQRHRKRLRDEQFINSGHRLRGQLTGIDLHEYYGDNAAKVKSMFIPTGDLLLKTNYIANIYGDTDPAIADASRKLNAYIKSVMAGHLWAESIWIDGGLYFIPKSPKEQSVAKLSV